MNKDVIFLNELVLRYKKYNEKKIWKNIDKIRVKIGVIPIYLVFLLYHSIKSKSIPMAYNNLSVALGILALIPN